MTLYRQLYDHTCVILATSVKNNLPLVVSSHGWHITSVYL